ncbi:MAG: hypothetical protein LUD15_02375 [Bacteroides sp.]|nr:hypothetical protein [Bacteroides sp.]
MKKLLIFIYLIGAPFFEIYPAGRIDSLLKVLDQTLSERAVYEEKKEADICGLKQQKK